MINININYKWMPLLWDYQSWMYHFYLIYNCLLMNNIRIEYHLMNYKSIININNNGDNLITCGWSWITE